MEQPPDKVVIEGFMLKKKRKALQGYARRYFRLSESGSLSYAFNPNSPIRDSISVPLAFISASRKLRTLDIDGGNCVYHCKCLSLNDFDKWATALKAFINIAHNHPRNERNVHAVGRQTLLASSETAPAVPADQLDRVYAALAKLSQPICDLELVAHELGQKTTTTVLSTLPASSSSSPQVPAPSAAASPAVAATLSSSTTTAGSSSFSAATAPSSTMTTTTTNAPPPSPSPGTTLTSSSSNTTGGGNGGSSSKFRFLGKRSNSTSLHGLHPHHHATPAPPVPAPPHSPGGVVRSPTLMSSSTFTSASASAAPPPRQPERSNSTATTTSSHSHSNPNPAYAPDSWTARQQLNEAISVLKATHAELIAAVQALPLVVVPSPSPPQPPSEESQQNQKAVSSSKDQSSSSSSTTTTPAPLQTTDLDSTRGGGGGGGGASGPYSYPYHPYSTSSASSPPGSPTGALNRSFAYQRTLGHTRNAPSRATTIASSSRASFVSAVEWNQPETAGAGAGGSEYWYDAVPVPGEFVLDDEEEEGAGRRRRRRSSSSSSSSSSRPPPGVSSSSPPAAPGERTASSPESVERRDSSSSESLNTVMRSDNEDEEEDEEAVETNIVAEDEDEDSGDDDNDNGAGDVAAADASSVHHASSPGVAEAGTEPTTTTTTTTTAVVAVQRRKVLPHPVAGDEFSMLGMLRKNVGKDLSTISFPVTMNEPLSALQRLAEELEYSDLLDRAAAAPRGSLERLMFVAVFAVSGAAGNKYRSSRKPFNPLLGETYECIRPERGFRFISEKVSHHPPVLAFHTEAASRGWQVSGHVAPNQKFWGRSMEIFVLGDCSVRFLDDDGEEYSIRKPSSFVKNLVAGTKYIEIVGDLVVSCLNSKAHAVVSFKEGSSWGGVSTRNKIEGRVVDERGATRIELVGRWDDAVDRKDGKHSFTRLWQIADSPPNPERYYGFSYFATTLNETTPLEAGLMAPTDSRLRPDQLALERGDVDEAERLKQVVEEKQRSKRKSGKAPEPKWFTRRREEEGGGTAGTGTGGAWSYAGGYFETREKKAFEDPDIF